MMSKDDINNGNSNLRKQRIENEIDMFVKQAEEEELEKEMRLEGVKALKIAANKFAYRKKYYDMSSDKFVVYPSVMSCLVGNEIYEEAEKYYYDDGDDFPLKYIAALRSIALMAGGAQAEENIVESMAQDVPSDDEFFSEDPNATPATTTTPTPTPQEPESGQDDSANDGFRKKLIDNEIELFVKKAEEEELEKEMRLEGIKALKTAAYKLAYRKKYYDMSNDKFVVYPSVMCCLAGHDIYEEAEKYYYDDGDDFPLKYTAALRNIALLAGGAEEEEHVVESMAQEVQSDDEYFTQEKVASVSTMPKKEADPVPTRMEPDPTGKGACWRKQLIEKEIDMFVKKAEQEELDKEMRLEGVEALKIAANKLAYRKKYYDMSNDQFLVYPSVTSCLAGHDIYEEAEKYYYDDGDDFPLKYIAALRNIALAAGGAEEEENVVESMAQEVQSDDEFFTEERIQTLSMPQKKVPPQSRRTKRIEEEIDIFVKKAEEEELEKEMRQEGVDALKIAARKFAYRKKYYDMGNDKFQLYPSVASCLSGNEIYEEAEKYYYDEGDDFPLKYTAALRSIALAAGGAEEEEHFVESMAQEVQSDDELFG